MARCDRLLQKAQASPTNLRFSELCTLAECWGYRPKGGRGSHYKFKHEHLRLPARFAMLVFQDNHGKAKPYQVDQLLKAIVYIQDEFPNYG